MADCFFNGATIMNGTTFDREAILKVSEDFYAYSEVSWKSVNSIVIDKCIDRVEKMKRKDKKNDLKEDKDKKCPKKPRRLMNCIHSQHFVQCPTSAWTASEYNELN